MRNVGICFALLALFLAGCAVTGPKFSDASRSLPPVAADKARIFFYRDAGFVGGGVRPPIILDGVIVGQSLPGGVFYKDVAPGAHRVQVMTEITSSVDVAAGPGEVRYVKTTPAWGFTQGRMEVVAVGPAEGEPAIRDLALTDGSGGK